MRLITEKKASLRDWPCRATVAGLWGTNGITLITLTWPDASLLFAVCVSCMFLFECTCKWAVLVFLRLLNSWTSPEQWRCQTVTRDKLEPNKMFLNDTKCAHSSRFKGKGNCHQHRVTRAAQTAGTRLISVTCFMVHALMLVRLDHRCNIGLLLSVPLKLLKLWLRLIPDTLFTPQVAVCVCAARRLQRLLLQSFWEELGSRWRPFSVFWWTDCSHIGFKGQHRVLHGHVAADGRVD